MQLTGKSKKLEADFYFSEKIIQQLGLQHSPTVIPTSPDTIMQQLGSKNYDLVIIGTAHRYFNVFNRIASKYKTALIVHNQNFANASTVTLLRNVFKEETAYRLKLLLKEGLLGVPKLHRKAAALFVLDKNLTNSNFRFLPLFHTSKISFQNSSVPSVVIPGAVSQKRRDYETVFKILRQVKNQLNITFLGKAAGKEQDLLNNLKKTVAKQVEITYFSEKVSVAVFNDVMEKADLLWCPVHDETSFFSVPEFYGKTKMSGNIGDAIKFGKPAVFPESYQSKYPFVLSETDFEGILNGNQKIHRVDFSAYALPAVLENFENALLTIV